MAWAVALASFDRELDSLEQALAAGRDLELDVDALPVAARLALGPLPFDLRERAAEVHGRMARVEQSMVLSLHRAKGSHALVDRLGTGRAVPRFVDTRG